MGVTITEASYNTTLAIVLAGVAPLVWSPLANVYGRRPVYIFSSIIGIAAGAGCAVATKWGNLLVARCFVGVGTSAGMGIGASVVSDLYFMHERGRYVLELRACFVSELIFRQIYGHLCSLVRRHHSAYPHRSTYHSTALPTELILQH